MVSEFIFWTQTRPDNVLCYPKFSQHQDRGIKINSAGPGGSHGQGYEILSKLDELVKSQILMAK